MNLLVLHSSIKSNTFRYVHQAIHIHRVIASADKER